MLLALGEAVAHARDGFVAAVEVPFGEVECARILSVTWWRLGFGFDGFAGMVGVSVRLADEAQRLRGVRQ